MTRAGYVTLSLLLFALAILLGGCAMKLELSPDSGGLLGAGQAASAIGGATGNPLLTLLGQGLLAVGGAAAAYKAAVTKAKSEDNAPLTPAQAANVKAAVKE